MNKYDKHIALLVSLSLVFVAQYLEGELPMNLREKLQQLADDCKFCLKDYAANEETKILEDIIASAEYLKEASEEYQSLEY